jgi:hypothetical protein
MKLQNILFEALSDMANIQPIYHYTTSYAAHKIIDSDTLLGRDPDVGYYDKQLDRAKKKAAISFTRNRNMDLRQSLDWGNLDGDVDDNELVFDVVFVINRDKLRTKYKLEPFSFDYSMMHEEVTDKEEKIDFDNMDFNRYMNDPEYKKAFFDYYSKNNKADDGEDDYEEPPYQKDTEFEERVIIDKITPLRPYVMNIIYNGPDELLKKKIKKYLGKPTYVGKPRIDYDKTFKNWAYPSTEEFKTIFNEKGKEYFRNFKEFMQAVRDGRIIRFPKEHDKYTDGRTSIGSKRKLMDYVKNNPQKYTVEGVEAIYTAYKKGDKVELPVMVVFEMGERLMLSGNVVMDAAYHSKITPRILLIKSSAEYEEED